MTHTIPPFTALMIILLQLGSFWGHNRLDGLRQEADVRGLIMKGQERDWDDLS